MEVQPDFKELLALFNANKVEYLIVGGYAMAFHGAPRYTGDIDLLIHPTAENAKRILAALAAFGFGQVGLHEPDFQTPGQVVQLGVPPVRVDIITSVEGLSWEQAIQGKTGGDYGGVPVDYIGRQELILNKRAAGRQKDLADIEALGEDRRSPSQ